MANLGNISTININGNEMNFKDASLTNVVNEIIRAIGANNFNIAERINNLHNRAFDNTIKISSNNDSEISNIQDGIYKIQYITIDVVEEENVETIVNSGILIQENNNQYLYRDGQTKYRIKTNNVWGIWFPHDYSQDYLTFEALEDTTFTFSENNLQYSLDNGTTWSTLTANTATPTITTGNTIMWKQIGLPPVRDKGIGTFSATGNFNAFGNIMSLYYGDNFNDKTDLTGRYWAFCILFKNNSKLIDASNLILPAIILEDDCYECMFSGCASLTTAPELPATTLTTSCYEGMFSSCTSLTTAPELPATTLATSCYKGMFSGCASLTTAPELPATTLASSCYWAMFVNCASLTTAPELPATTLASSCYSAMFASCTSLTTAPKLPATTLESSCYETMFISCTSLTTAPELPATTLASSCYKSMFVNCTSLNYIKCLATDISAYNSISGWVFNIVTSGIFIKANNMSDWTIENIPHNWVSYTEDEYKEVKHYELNNINGLPAVTSTDNGKILMVVNGQWTIVTPSTLYSGSSAPNDANGNNGDIYIQTS